MVQEGLDRIPSAHDAVTRRAAITTAGVLATSVGLGAAGVVTAGPAIAAAAKAYGAKGPGPAGHSAFNVREYGAAGDGDTDDTAKIQAAIDAARATGGIVFFPPGTYSTGRLILYSRVHLRGSGVDATVLRLRPGADSAILESEGFSTLTGTRSDGGITTFSVRDLTLDGNKAHNRAGGYGMRVYGYGYELTEIVVFNCGGDGIVSEWGPTAGLPPPSHQMEARLSAVRSHDNEGYGVNFAGPHDSMFVNCLAFENRAGGFRMAGDSNGSLMVSCHARGPNQHVSFELAAAGISCMNCCADLDGGVGVRVFRNDCRWIGGLVVGQNHAKPATEIGVQFVPGAHPTEPAGTVIDTKIMNCGTAAVDFGADRGLSSVRATLSQPGVPDANGKPVAGTGLGWIGTPAPTTQVEITEGIGSSDRNLVVRPAFDLRAQPPPPAPGADSVRIFARTVGGRTQLCAMFPSGAVQVMATQP
jgi:hypothetical protein